MYASYRGMIVDMQIAWQRVGLGVGVLLIVSGGVGIAFAAATGQQPATTRIKSAVPQKAGTVSKPEPLTLPGGGQTLFPQYRLVALYGSPDIPGLGALGAQPMETTLARVKQLAAEYQPLAKETILPTLEIIATVASASPTSNNDYSQEIEAAKLLAWAEAARAADVYVILDLQSGRTDFLTQAKAYSEVLKLPNVGLALDPEWRLKPNEMPTNHIGSVDASEVNQVAAWLAGFTAEHKLPQKLFLLHQFKLNMITNRETLDMSHTELAYLIQMDGNGTQSQKQDTWRVVQQNAPAGMHFGWKNFYTQDQPMLSPAETMQVILAPWYVSYQ